jgi:hypothetical protein
MKHKMLMLSEIEKMVNKVNEDLGLDKNKLPSYGTTNDNNATFVMVTDDGYSLFGFNPYHNKENQRLIINTLDANELIFEIFKESTRFISHKYEFENRVPNQDFRIVMFNKHIDILNSLKLDKKFIIKLRAYYDYLLQLKEPLPLPDKW